ncbi:MAG: TonB-dependent receptor [Bacteroidales bacterium]|nr:TonB-dependent receptor [Bacteroidales bacterium]
MKIFFLLFVLVLFFNYTFSQYLTISGKVFDKKTREPLPGASVFIVGTTWGTSTDIDGNFKLTNIKKGTYDIVISYVGYVSDTIKRHQVASNNNSFEVYLNENSFSLSEVNIVAQRIQHTEVSVIQDIKNSEQVVNGVSSEQITKNQDRNTAEVVKRVPGITISENRFVIVRGLADRYNSTLLNESKAPSFENDKKAFAFDMLPSGIVERVMVFKTGSAELPGDFSGGLIRVDTKKNVDSNFTSISYTTRYQTNTTFKTFLTDKGNFIENFGFSNGSRNLPNNFPANLNQHDNTQTTIYAKTLKNKWDINKNIAMPDQSLSLTMGRRIREKLISLTSIGYSNSKQFYHADMLNYNSFDMQNMQSDTIYKYNDNTFQRKNNLLLMQNFVYALSPKHMIEFKNLLSQNNSNQVVERQGVNFEEGFAVKNYAFNYQERTLINSQLCGDYSINENNNLAWNVFYSLTINNQPDYRRIRTVKNLDNVDQNTPYQVVIAPSASTLDAGRFFAKLNENIKGGSVDYKFNIQKNDQKIVTIKTGTGIELKNREFNARWISYKKANSGTFDNNLLLLPINQVFSNENLNETTGFTITEGTNPSDRYYAENQLFWFYISSSFKIHEHIQIVSGLRNEYNIQSLYSRNYSNKPVNVENPIWAWLPSINSSYNFNEKSLIRLAYFRSINRPEFRELAPFSYYDFQLNNVLIGNENLKDAFIHNIDFRYELYPENNEMINVGIFYKHFTNPIEMYYVPGSGSGGTRNFTYRNAPSAYSLGIETEIRKSLKTIFDNNKFLENTGILFNAAYINSNVFLGQEAQGQSTNRPLMGQSPYVINAGIYYQNPYSGLQINLAYNVIGKRIFVVGTYGTPNVYEMPKNNLDLTITTNIYKNMKITFNINNLLNAKTLFMQDSNEDGRINHNDEMISQYRLGRNISMGLSYKF